MVVRLGCVALVGFMLLLGACGDDGGSSGESVTIAAWEASVDEVCVSVDSALLEATEGIAAPEGVEELGEFMTAAGPVYVQMGDAVTEIDLPDEKTSDARELHESVESLADAAADFQEAMQGGDPEDLAEKQRSWVAAQAAVGVAAAEFDLECWSTVGGGSPSETFEPGLCAGEIEADAVSCGVWQDKLTTEYPDIDLERARDSSIEVCLAARESGSEGVFEILADWGDRFEDSDSGNDPISPAEAAFFALGAGVTAFCPDQGEAVESGAGEFLEQVEGEGAG